MGWSPGLLSSAHPVRGLPRWQFKQTPGLAEDAGVQVLHLAANGTSEVVGRATWVMLNARAV